MVLALSGGGQCAAKQAQLKHRAFNAANHHVVTHLVGAQHQQEYASSKVAQQAAPGRANGHTRTPGSKSRKSGQ